MEQGILGGSEACFYIVNEVKRLPWDFKNKFTMQVEKHFSLLFEGRA